MKASELFNMILAKDSRDRIMAKQFISQIIEQQDISMLNELREMLGNYHDYPGYEIVVDKEEIEDRIIDCLKKTY
jgi:hypothetical protein